MKNTSISLFRQILDLVPKHEFEKIIVKHNGDKHKQTFDCWAHFVSMIFCQLAQANSLREICGGLKTCGGKLNHLGVESAPTKSNLTYANFCVVRKTNIRNVSAKWSSAMWKTIGHCSTLVTFLKWNLFVYRDLLQWLDQPFTKPPEPDLFQPEFAF